VIKLKDLLLEYSPHASEEFATDSKDGASKGLESKFKYFKKVSKEQSKHQKNSWWKSKAGVLSVDKKNSRYQVSKPDVPGKKIDYEQIKTIRYSYQVGDAIVPGNEEYAKYQLKDFLKDAKKAFSGYKMEKTSIRSHFRLKKGGNIYNLYFTAAMSGTFVSVESRV